MTELNQTTESPDPARTPRWGVIELLQVGSVLAFAAAWMILHQGRTAYFWAAVVAGILLAIVPFFLVKPPRLKPKPESTGLPEGPRGFKITRERRRTLAEICVPFDILATIDESMLDVYYKTGEEMREKLYFLLGRARVRPWLDIILLHAKVYPSPATVDPAAPRNRDDHQPSTKPETPEQVLLKK